MINWKRRLAKEWLIFLVAFSVGILIHYALPFIGSTIIEIEYSMAIKNYEDQIIRKYVQSYLANWKPVHHEITRDNKKRLIDEGIAALAERFSTGKTTSFELWHKKTIIIKVYKEIFPEYKNWEDDELLNQLPILDLSKIPEPPYKSLLQLPDYFFDKRTKITIVFGILSYLSVLLIRLTTWSVKYIKKDKLKND